MTCTAAVGEFVVEVTNTPIFDHGQKLVLSVVRDVTERKRAAEALQQMQEQLAHANRVATMGQLTASIAHEIAQPIGAVYNRANAALNFLNRDPPDLEEVREAISRIADAADRAREIIGGIRDQVKKAPPRKDMFDLNQAIEEVLLLAGNAITKDAIAVQTEFAKDLPLRSRRSCPAAASRAQPDPQCARSDALDRRSACEIYISAPRQTRLVMCWSRFVTQGRG